MEKRKWDQIQVRFEDGSSVQVSRRDFERLEEIAPILEALTRVKQMQRDVNRLLGEAEG